MLLWHIVLLNIQRELFFKTATQKRLAFQLNVHLEKKVLFNGLIKKSSSKPKLGHKELATKKGTEGFT